MGLAVKDIAASAAFYEKLGFTSFGGDITQKLADPEEWGDRHRPLPGDV
jgi:predicted lactoylglutathione lyase